MSLIYCFLMLLSTSAAVLEANTVINVYASDSQQAANKDKCKSPGVVAFSVGRKSLFAPSSLSRVPMDHEFYNKCKYFNMQTSVFTAPVSGVYFFYFGGSGARGSMINLRLYIGNPEKYVAATYNYNTAHGQASGSVIIEMKKQDHASVWLLSGAKINAHNPPSTHFNGYLISATEVEAANPTQC